jgi:hypothetical protein
MQNAEAACQKIFYRAGIRISWFHTLDPVTWRGPDVVVEAAILSHAPPSRSMRAFGTAIREKRVVLLYEDRIGSFGKLVDLPAELVLALALVHEIGHLFLDSNEHTAAGIMRAEWGQTELNDVRQSQLWFTREESQRMRITVTRMGSASGR